MRREPGNGSKLLLVETLCPHADQRHEQRNQWRREQQEDGHQIIEPAHHDGNQQWQQKHDAHLREEAREIAIEGFDVLDRLGRQGTALLPRHPDRA